MQSVFGNTVSGASKVGECQGTVPGGGPVRGGRVQPELWVERWTNQLTTSESSTDESPAGECKHIGGYFCGFK